MQSIKASQSIATEINRLEGVKAREVMTKKVTTVPPTMTVIELLDQVTKLRHIGFPIMDESRQVVGIVTLEDAMKVSKERRNKVSVGEIVAKSLIVVFS